MPQRYHSYKKKTCTTGTRRKNRTLPALLFSGAAIIVVLVLVLCSEKNTGKNPVYGSLEGRFNEPVSIEYKGARYMHREQDYFNLLFMGIDRESMEKPISGIRREGQADFLLLLSIDRETRSITPVHLDRDIMTDVQVYGVFGDPVGKRKLQLCLAYGFGLNPESSCMNTVQAVSNMLGGIEIDYYLAIDMDGISVLNDLMGGITVTLEDDFSSMDPAMIKGTTLTLQGKQAEYYLRSRMDVGDGTNKARMQRQQNYMNAALDVITQRISRDTAYFDKLLDALEANICTNLQRGTLANRAISTAAYQRNKILTIPGNHVVGEDGFVEFHADEAGLQRLVIDTFFHKEQ